MLLNNLYVINNLQYAEKDIIMAEININEQDAIFKGHFPGKPIMPGVCLINMLTDVLSESKKNRYSLESADFVKFITPLQPFITNKLTIRIVTRLETENRIKAEASIFFENVIFLKFKGCFEALKR